MPQFSWSGTFLSKAAFKIAFLDQQPQSAWFNQWSILIKQISIMYHRVVIQSKLLGLDYNKGLRLSKHWDKTLLCITASAGERELLQYNLLISGRKKKANSMSKRYRNSLQFTNAYSFLLPKSQYLPISTLTFIQKPWRDYEFNVYDNFIFWKSNYRPGLHQPFD